MSDSSSSLVRIIDSTRIRLPGALDGAIRMEFFGVAREFLQRSNIWREAIPITVVPSVACYELVGEHRGLVNRLIWVEGQRQISEGAPARSGPPRPAALLRTGVLDAEIRIDWLPSQTELWFAHVALTVADPTDRLGLPFLPSWIVEKYAATLTDGLVARMAAIPLKPYSNKALAAYHGREFRMGTNLAKNETAHSNTLGGQAWAFPQGFRSRTQKVW